MPALFHTAKGLVHQQHAWFLWALQNQVGRLEPARMVDGQEWEQTYFMDGTRVALSDTERNTTTDKKGKRHSYGTVTIEFIATEPAEQGQGSAGFQMAALGRLADKWNITLRLRVLAHETSPMNDEQLSAWYQKLGYTGTDGHYLSRPSREQRQRALVEQQAREVAREVAREAPAPIGMDSALALRIAA